jgi:hypothetical protein
MEASRLRTGELIAGVSAVALFIIMFLPWFGIDFGGAEIAEDLGVAVPEASADFNAWESFDFIDIVLLVTILVAVGLAVASAMAQTVALPVAASALTAGLGILSTLLVLYRVLDPVGEDGVERKFWLFVGLIAAAGIAYGGWRAMQEEGTTFGQQADRLQDRTGGPGGGGPGTTGGTGTEGPPPP